MKSELALLESGQSLSRLESRALLESMLSAASASNTIEIGKVLLALRAKKETAEEILGFLDCLRSHAVHIPSGSGVIDVCGTGGDGLGTFNVSTVVAFVVAACGVSMAKHGNRSVSSRSGSFDVLENLGIQIEATPEGAARSLKDKGLVFLLAPAFHPSLAKMGPIRKSLGVYTIFNVLGPLLNPVNTSAQLIGVYRPELLALLAEVLRDRGMREAMIVHGDDGLDEISISTSTQVAHLKEGKTEFYTVSPEDFGLSRAPLESVQGGGPSENAVILNDILQGAKGPKRDLILINASAALKIAGKARDFREGVELAANAIDSKKALGLLGEMACPPKQS
jgi:anthranilate phosphoribosyltransferase